MKLIKNHMNMNKVVGNTSIHFYINEEFTVSDVNQPVGNVIKEVANPVIDSVKVRDEQVAVYGVLNFAVLYTAEGNGMLQGLQGEIPFEEVIRMPNLKEENEVYVRITVDSISVKVINSKKLLVKAELTAYATAEELMEEEVAVDIDNAAEASVLKTKVEALSMVANKKDTFRVREDIMIPQGKPSIYKIVWKDVKIKNIVTRLMDKMMQINGEISVFFMYIPDEDSMLQQWHEATITFGGTIDIPEVQEGMISYINVQLQNANLDLNTDDLGESREVSADIMLKLDIKAYEEKEMDILKDVYSPYSNIVPIREKGMYHKLLVKNSSKNKETIRLSINQSKGNILQICNSGADIKVDNVAVGENGLVIEGKIKAYVIYVSSNDNEPVCTAYKEIEFSHKIDAEGITSNDEYYINWHMEQVNANMVSADEIEIKTVMVVEAIVFKKCEESIITDIDEEPLDMTKIAQMPTVKGHIVQSGETLWDIAKENYTTMEKIIAVNNIKDGQVKRGDRLLILKATRK